MNAELSDRLDFIEFRQELLFSNTELDRYLFEIKATRKQNTKILDLFDSLRNQIDNGQKVSSPGYEQSIYDLLPQINNDYHVAEIIAKLLHQEGRYEEVFETLYGNVTKFQTYLENQRSL